jgi:hypothetical protein
MVTTILTFTRMQEGVHLLLKTNKLTNGISKDKKHECKFYESIDQWWDQVVMRNVTAVAIDT